MPIKRLEKARESLPSGYQFGDAVEGITDWNPDWPSIPDRHERLANGKTMRIPQKFMLTKNTKPCR